MTPAELMRAILLADVDLLWNGGIGTYVKAASETDAEVGDKANDPIRVNGGELRAKCVGEGGNLGLTQRGRIEYALSGGRINTDFIDNSAGVDTSDHEVNIKILLDRVVRQRRPHREAAQRPAGVDDRRGRHAGAAPTTTSRTSRWPPRRSQAPALLHVHEDWVRRLERQGLLDRELEFLPSRKAVAERLEARQGLTPPELSVLLAYTKIVLADELLATDLPDDPFLRTDLFSYFPTPMRHTYRDQMEAHPLRREIIVTQVVNDLVNGAGITFFHRLSEETGATAEELVAGQLRGPRDLRVPSAVRRDQRASTTSCRPTCRPACGSRCARWSSARRAG